MMFDKLFQVDVIMRCKKRALQEARKNQPGLILWTDGLKVDQGQVTAVVCWEDKFISWWKKKNVFLEKNKEIVDAELWAIWEVLDIANGKAIVINIPVTIFCDSKKALNAIAFRSSKCKKHEFLKDFIYQKNSKLQSNRHHTTFCWVAGHSGIFGNEKADQAAKNELKKVKG